MVLVSTACNAEDPLISPQGAEVNLGFIPQCCSSHMVIFLQPVNPSEKYTHRNSRDINPFQQMPGEWQIMFETFELKAVKLFIEIKAFRPKKTVKYQWTSQSFHVLSDLAFTKSWHFDVMIQDHLYVFKFVKSYNIYSDHTNVLYSMTVLLK